MRAVKALAIFAGLVGPVFAQQGRGAAEGGLPPRFRWEGMAPWGTTHYNALVEAIKLTAMNPVNIDAVRVEPFKLFDNLYYIGLKHVSAFLITTSAGPVLLDAGLPNTSDLILENIRKVGFRPQDIKYILVSHSHPDHFGGAGKAKELSGAPVLMSAEDWKAVEAQQAAAKQAGRLYTALFRALY